MTDCDVAIAQQSSRRLARKRPKSALPCGDPAGPRLACGGDRGGGIRLLLWRGLAPGMAASLVCIAAAEAQQSNAKRVAVNEPLAPAAPAVAPPPAPADPIGAAVQQKLSVKGRT